MPHAHDADQRVCKYLGRPSAMVAKRLERLVGLKRLLMISPPFRTNRIGRQQLSGGSQGPAVMFEIRHHGSREQRSRRGCWMGLALVGPVHSAWAPGQFRAMMCIGISEREFMRGTPAATDPDDGRGRGRPPPFFFTARVRAGGLAGSPRPGPA